MDEDYRMNNYRRDAMQAIVMEGVPGNTDPTILFSVGYAVDMSTLLHCNYAGNDCWKVRTHPTIANVSAESGYTTGGQTLYLDGHGLNGTDISVTIDGVVCDVIINDFY